MEAEQKQEIGPSNQTQKPPDERDDPHLEYKQLAATMQVNDMLCGIGSCRPRWLQKFANTHVYTVIYCLIGLIQGMFYTYFTSTISTLERRFGVKTRTSGIVMSGNEVSQILFSVVITYYASKGQRPKWLAFGILCVSLACFILALPHLVFGAGQDIEELLNNSNANQTIEMESNERLLCKHNDPSKTTKAPCTDSQTNEAFWGMALIFLGQFVSGIGSTSCYILGMTYLDDNIKKDKSPIMMGITMALRLLGPMLGFMLGSACLKLFIIPTIDPGITPSDSRWLGAWWLGFIVLASCLAVIAIPMSMFPKQLPKSKDKKALKMIRQKSQEFYKNELLEVYGNFQNLPGTDHLIEMDKASFKDLWKSLLRLLKNTTLSFFYFAGVLHIFAVAGFFTFSPKYLESQYHISAANSSLAAGLSGIGVQIFGILLSGWIIGRFKPKPAYITGWNLLTNVVYIAGLMTLMSLGCVQSSFDGFIAEDNTMNITSSCNADCQCSLNKFSPVCFETSSGEKTNFYSACYAGCTLYEKADNHMTFSNCRCLHDMQSLVGGSGQMHNLGNSSYSLANDDITVTTGYCNSNCNNFLYYVIATAILKFITSTSRVGSTLLLFRCVAPADKSLAMGIMTTVLSIFAWIPYPIVYGAIIDSTCLIWKETPCGEKGSCALYDSDLFRYYIHAVTAAILLAATVFDILIWYNTRQLKLYEDEEQNSTKMRNLDTVKDEKPKITNG